MSHPTHDRDVFVVLARKDDDEFETLSAFNLPHNSKWLITDEALKTAAIPSLTHESSASPAPSIEALDFDSIVFSETLVVKLDSLEDVYGGLRCGSDPRSSRILFGIGGSRGVSANQFPIFVDDKLQIFLSDPGSTLGTAVEHARETGDEAFSEDEDLRAIFVFDRTSCLTALGQVLDGLRHLHGQGNVHRDLEPAKLQFERQPHLRVVIKDFGQSAVAPSEDMNADGVHGTYHYIAPEAWQGDRRYGAPADVYSAGVIAQDWLYDHVDEPAPYAAFETRVKEITETYIETALYYAFEIEAPSLDQKIFVHFRPYADLDSSIALDGLTVSVPWHGQWSLQETTGRRVIECDNPTAR